MFIYRNNYYIKSIIICMIPLFYNIYNYDHYYVNLLLDKIDIFNNTQCTTIFNYIGTYTIIKDISLELNIKWSIKYK